MPMATAVTAPCGQITFAIKAGGQEVPNTFQVKQVKVTNQVNKIPHCELEIVTANFSGPDNKNPVLNEQDFEPGKTIEVQAGYNSKNSTVFKGIIMKQQIQVNYNQPTVLNLVAKGEAVKMTVAPRNEVFTNKTNNQIISSIFGQHGISAQVASTSTKNEQTLQYYVTDWDFVLATADSNGFVVQSGWDKVVVDSPAKAKNSGKTFIYGTDIFGFDGGLDAQYQYPKVVASAWDIKNQKLDQATATPKNSQAGNESTTTLSKVLNIGSFEQQSGGFLTNADLKTWAETMAQKSTYAKVRGSFNFQGNPSIEPGQLITVTGLSNAIDGQMYVSAVTQDIDPDHWQTSATVGLSQEKVTQQVPMNAAPASGLLPAINGLQVGKVMQIDNDPEGAFRVKVKVPLINSADGIWARLATFYASSGVGALFYPEVNDEVVLGFFNDDPRYPVILGSMYSNNVKPPTTPDKKNNLKEIVSREKLTVSFDEENKVLTLKTPGNNSMVLSDKAKGITIKDQHGNSITLDQGGIALKTSKAITLNGTQKVSTSGGQVSIDAKQQFTAKGLQSTVEGSTQLNLKGAQATLQGSAMTTIKGALVKIN